MKIAVCKLDDLPEGTATSVVAGDRTIAVFNVAGELRAIDNRCAHNGGPLSEGTVRNGIVTCPWHWWRYNLATGERLGSERIGQQTFDVAIDGDLVTVEVAAPQPAQSMREQLLEHAKQWTRDQ